MSNARRTPLAEATVSAVQFMSTFADAAISWMIAGSIRRSMAHVGDVEHVVVPNIITATLSGSMFPTEGLNAIWMRLEQMLDKKMIEKAVYSDGSNRWGDKYRGVVYRDVRHEIFMADADNVGAITAIRTGSADFSKKLVTMMLNAGNYRQQGGYVVRTSGPQIGERVPCPDERTFFQLCGHPWVEPANRV